MRKVYDSKKREREGEGDEEEENEAPHKVWKNVFITLPSWKFLIAGKAFTHPIVECCEPLKYFFLHKIFDYDEMKSMTNFSSAFGKFLIKKFIKA